MPALLTLMKPPTSPSERRSGSGHWSSAQQEELQLQALTILATIAPLMVEEYVSCQGIACLLLLLDWCVRKGEDAAKHHERQIRDWRDSIVCLKGQRSNTNIHVSCQSALEQNRVLAHSLFFTNAGRISSFCADALFGPSSHGTGGGGSKTAQMFHCVRVLRSVTSLCVDSVNQDLCDQGIINQLLGKLTSTSQGSEISAETFHLRYVLIYRQTCCFFSGILMQMEASPDEEDVITLEIKLDIQLILSLLCESDMHRKVKLRLWPW